MEKKRLGRGLDALLATEWTESMNEVNVNLLDHNPHQPRKNFDAEEISLLSASVKTHGILQPIVVRQSRRALSDCRRRAAAACRPGSGAEIGADPRREFQRSGGVRGGPDREHSAHRSQPDRESARLQGLSRPLRAQPGTARQAARAGPVQRWPTSSTCSISPPRCRTAFASTRSARPTRSCSRGSSGKESQVALFKQIVAMGLSVKATEALIREQKEAGRRRAEPRRARRRRRSRRRPTSRGSRTSCGRNWRRRSRSSCAARTRPNRDALRDRTTISSGCWKCCGARLLVQRRRKRRFKRHAVG